jgi:Fe-S-cluster-containing hydrogenase component 2
MLYIDSERCTGCADCVAICPAGAIILAKERAHIDQTLCQGCERCIDVCPETAILSIIEPDEVATPPVTARPLPQTSASKRIIRQAMPVLGAALAFVAREVVPPLVNALLHSTQGSRGTSAQRPYSNESAATSGGSHGGQQHRARRRGGQHRGAGHR